MSEITGYIIACRAWDDRTKLEMGKGSFGMTAGEAWRRHVGHEKAGSLDFSVYIQRWSDRGYGPHEVKLSLGGSS